MTEKVYMLVNINIEDKETYYTVKTMKKLGL